MGVNMCKQALSGETTFSTQGTQSPPLSDTNKGVSNFDFSHKIVGKKKLPRGAQKPGETRKLAGDISNRGGPTTNQRRKLSKGKPAQHTGQHLSTYRRLPKREAAFRGDATTSHPGAGQKNHYMARPRAPFYTFAQFAQQQGTTRRGHRPKTRISCNKHDQQCICRGAHDSPQCRRTQRHHVMSTKQRKCRLVHDDTHPPTVK